MSSVYGIVVTFNPDIALLVQQIESSVKQLDYLLIVDNNSSNVKSIVEALNGNHIFSAVEICMLPKNIGLAAGQNIGIKKAKSLNFSHVILFDQDSLIEDKFVMKLLECEEKLIKLNHKVAAVGPVFFDPTNGVHYPATVYRGPFISKIRFDDLEYTQATFIIASGCLIRIEVLIIIGIMCEDLFVDYIDVEWSLRAKSQGYAVFMTKNARMAHTVGDKRISIAGRTISVHGPVRRYYLIRNSFMMLRKSYVPLGYKVREIIFNMLRFLVGLFQSKEKNVFIYYSFKGFMDGVRGKFGPFNAD